MKKVSSLVAALFLTAIFTMTLESCGKYDEGPSFSLKSKKRRLSREWVRNKLIDGGTGSTNNSTGTDITEYTKDGIINTTIGGKKTINAGTWEFSSDKKDLLTTRGTGNSTSSETRTILRLTSKELWFIEDDKDEIHYKAK